MTGKCCNCGGATQKDSDKFYKRNCAHIVSKAHIPSVSTHYKNIIELCWQCHFDYDKDFQSAASMNCFNEAKRKFDLFKHLIPNEELRKVNPHFLSLNQPEILHQPQKSQYE